MNRMFYVSQPQITSKDVTARRVSHVRYLVDLDSERREVPTERDTIEFYFAQPEFRCSLFHLIDAVLAFLD